MTTTLNPSQTNTVECTTCGWKRFHDATRPYRSGHTHPTNLTECHEQLSYAVASVQPPEIYLLGEPEAFESLEGGPSPAQEAALAAVFELEGTDVDDAIAAAEA